MSVPTAWNELHRQLHESLVILPDKPEETSEGTLKALWQKALGNSVSAVKADTLPLEELNQQQLNRLRNLIAQRLAGIPLAHLTGRQNFMGIEFIVGPEALVPRRETELLAAAALEQARECALHLKSLTIVDVCTGSGNVALALASHLQRDNIPAKIFAADLSEDAVQLAQKNADNLALNHIVEFRAGDLLAPFELARFANSTDLLTCNPPYINRAKVESMPIEIAAHEPRLAFDGGPFGVSILMRLIDEAPRYLKPGGWLVFEVGLGQGPALVKRMERNSVYSEIKTTCDAAGAIRALSIRKT